MWRHLNVLGLAMCVGLLFGQILLSQVVHANHIDALTDVGAGGDYFRDWDFIDQSSRTKANVDWPVTIIFMGNAEVDKVKNGPLADFPVTGSTKWSRLEDRGSWVWDSDPGRKEHGCASYQNGFTFHHTRVYADPNDDRMNPDYSISWG